MSALGAFAGLFLKKASGNLKIKKLITNYNFYLGAFLYLTAALINIYVLKYLEYSVVLPLTSITYVWTMVISYFVLGEKITLKKVMGVCLILIGTFSIAYL
jgi:drug/metabolite transporter (DMT)-like permease